jgi:CheY-like chemotaxis protein
VFRSSVFCSALKDRKLSILLVEDDPHDVFFIRRALEKAAPGHTLRAVSNGAEAIDYLHAKSPFQNRLEFPPPNVILTDLKMPQMDGFELLRWLQAHEDCAVIPTIVLSSSAMESDVKQAYRLGANAFLRKPTSVHDLASLLSLTCEFWWNCERPKVPEKC